MAEGRGGVGHNNAHGNGTLGGMGATPLLLVLQKPRASLATYCSVTVPSIWTVVYEYEPAYRSHATPLSTANVVALVVQSAHHHTRTEKNTNAIM